MAEIDEDCRTYLLTKSAITALVGTRIWPEKIPESRRVFPCIVYTLVSQVPAHDLAGGAGWAESRLQLDSYAKTSKVRGTLTETIRDKMQGFSGTMGGATVDSVVYQNSRNEYEIPQDKSDVGLYRNAADYWLRHQQAVPTFA